MFENKNQNIMMLVLLAALLILTPTVIRMINNDTSTITGETYYSTRITSLESSQYDGLQGRRLPFNLLNLLTPTGIFALIIYKIIPGILGLISIMLAYSILHRHNISEKTIIAILILAIVSPIFMYSFMDFKNYSFIIFFSILGMYFLTKEQVMQSGMAFGIVPLIDALSGIITLVLVYVYALHSEKRQRFGNRIVLIVLTASIIISLILSAYQGFSPLDIFHLRIHNVLTDIGALIGVSFAIIILTIIGLILLWENGWRNLVTYIGILLLIALSLFNDEARIYMNFIVMVYAGFAFIHLNKRKWSIAIIKKTTVLLIICSIFFSSLVYVTKIVRSEPSSEYIDALDAVVKQALPGETILNHPSNGYMIEYYTNMTVFMDDRTTYYNRDRHTELENLAVSRNLDRTEAILKQYGVRYILIDKEFEAYLQEREGLLFLIETSGKFTAIYQSDNVNVWMYTS